MMATIEKRETTMSKEELRVLQAASQERIERALATAKRLQEALKDRKSS